MLLYLSIKTTSKEDVEEETHRTNTLYVCIPIKTILWLKLIVNVEKDCFHSDLIVLYKNHIILISIKKIQNKMKFSFFNHLFWPVFILKFDFNEFRNEKILMQ